MRQAVPLVACLATTGKKPLAAMTFRFVFDVIRNQPGTFELEETFAALRKRSLDRNHDQTNSLDIQFGTDIAFFHSRDPGLVA